MRFKTLEDQEAARLVLKDAHANRTLGHGQFYRARDCNLPDLVNPVCPAGHLSHANIWNRGMKVLAFDAICRENGIQAGFDFVMKQVDEADIG